MKNTFFEDMYLILVVLISATLGLFYAVYHHAKKALFPALILCSLFAQGQTVNPNAAPKIQYGRVAAGAGLMFIAGAANGTNEAISHHYGAFQKRFPNANPQFWNPAESWRNKYKNNDPEQGRAFPGSMGPLVWTTDAYHLTNTIRTGGMFAGTVTLTLGQKRPAWQYLFELATGFAAYSAGNYFTYNLLFK